MRDVIKHATSYMVPYKELKEAFTSSEIWDALYDAYKVGTITKQQYDEANAEVEEYLEDYPSLRVALYENNLPYKYRDRIALLSDWDNRPELK